MELKAPGVGSQTPKLAKLPSPRPLAIPAMEAISETTVGGAGAPVQVPTWLSHKKL